jgi:hypothetical protein
MIIHYFCPSVILLQGKTRRAQGHAFFEAIPLVHSTFNSMWWLKGTVSRDFDNFFWCFHIVLHLLRHILFWYFKVHFHTELLNLGLEAICSLWLKPHLSSKYFFFFGGGRFLIFLHVQYIFRTGSGCVGWIIRPGASVADPNFFFRIRIHKNFFGFGFGYGFGFGCRFCRHIF